jgi:pimeloyl-ACP methyl ester carboxylesterase
MIEHKTVDLTSVQMHYVETNTLGVPILLLHAVLDSWESYQSLIPEFASVAHVYALDLRGFGQSSRMPGEYKIINHVQDLHQFVQQVIDRQVVLAGHSYGGYAAAMFAARYPNWVRGLVVEDSDLLLPPDAKFPQFGATRDNLLRYKAEGRSLKEYENACAQDIYREGLTRLECFGWETVRSHARQRWQMDPSALDAVINGSFLEGYVAEEFLPAINCPTHLVYRIGQDEYVQKIAELIPRCTYTIVDTEDHRVHETQPEGYVRAVKGFIIALLAPDLRQGQGQDLS